MRKVNGDAAFAGVEKRVCEAEDLAARQKPARSKGPHRGSFRRLDPDHVGAEVGQQSTRIGRMGRGQVEDADSCQCARVDLRPRH